MSGCTSLLKQLTKRGLISQTSKTTLVHDRVGVYLGVDPTAASLHLGNLMPLMVLMHFYINGHNVFPLVGGATGAVGDPSGRTTERQALENSKRVSNVNLITAQMHKLAANSVKMAAKYNPSFTNTVGKLTLTNNLDWWKDISMLHFLGAYGRHIRVKQMLARDSVAQRMQSESGLGYNEFSYQIMQAYDFYHLNKTYNCNVQIGGHDQWGNIVAGIDLINRLQSTETKNKSEPLGITVPLLVAKNGEKFGKSAGNAVFLSSELTKPYTMFQHLIKSPDEMVQTYLKALTFIPVPEIDAIMAAHNQDLGSRSAQRRLAREVTELVHGAQLAKSAEDVSNVMFGSESTDNLNAETVLESFTDQQLVTKFPSSDVIGQKWKPFLANLINKSKSETQRLLNMKSVYYGLQKQVVEDPTVEQKHIEPNGLLLVRVGKTDYYAVKLE